MRNDSNDGHVRLSEKNLFSDHVGPTGLSEQIWSSREGVLKPFRVHYFELLLSQIY